MALVVALASTAVALSGCVGLDSTFADDELSDTVELVPEDADFVVKVDGDVLQDDDLETVFQAAYDRSTEKSTDEDGDADISDREGVDTDAEAGGTSDGEGDTSGGGDDGLPDSYIDHLEDTTEAVSVEDVDEIVVTGYLHDDVPDGLPIPYPKSYSVLISSDWSTEDVVQEIEAQMHGNLSRESYNGVTTYVAEDPEVMLADLGDGEFALSGIRKYGFGRTDANTTRDVVDVHEGDLPRFSGTLEDEFRGVNHGHLGFAVEPDGRDVGTLVEGVTGASGVLSTDDGRILYESTVEMDDPDKASEITADTNHLLLGVERREDIRNITYPLQIEREGTEIHVRYSRDTDDLAEAIEAIEEIGIR